MTYSVAEAPPFTDNVIWPGSLWCVGGQALLGTLFALPVSTAWPTANKAIYLPFVLPVSRTVYQVGWLNGATPSGTREVGVYDAAGTKIITGAATGSGANVIQRVDVTDTLLQPGQYWLAATDSGVGTWFAIAPASGAPICAAFGMLTQTSANPLPSTATFALDNVLNFIPWGFLQLRATL